MTVDDLLAGEASFLDQAVKRRPAKLHPGSHDLGSSDRGGARLSRRTGLLSNDALIVAMIYANGFSRIASSDDDFDRVAGMTRYEPN